MMPRGFKYDVIKLIEGVRDRSCLWDKTLESYKDRVERRTAWEEIFAMLDERYYEMTSEEKKFVEEQISTKWTNVRDTFLRSLKTKMGKPKKKYLYYEQLKFLTKVTPQDMTFDFNIDDEPEDHKEVVQVIDRASRKRTKKQRITREDSPPKKHVAEIEDFDNNVNDDDADLNSCDDPIEPRLMNEDEAFFASLLPTVVRYTLEERLDFRMEVLSVMKRINDKRKWSD